MKKTNLIALALAFLSLAPAFADDTMIKVYGGGFGTVKEVEPKDGMAFARMEQNDDIRMESEHVIITLKDESYEVDANFVFRNYGEETTVLIGFPIMKHKLDDFETYVDGKKVPCKTYGNYDTLGTIEKGTWEAKEVSFGKNQTRRTRVTYSCDYGYVNGGLVSGHDTCALYIYGTGKAWKGTIGKITIDVRIKSLNQFLYYIDFLGESTYGDTLPKSYSAFFINADTLRLEAEDIEPGYMDDCVDFYLHTFLKEKKFIDNMKEYYRREGFGNYTLISAMAHWIVYTSNVNKKYGGLFYSKEQLRFFRNTIYASHGYSFKSKDLQRQFQDIDGYSPVQGVSDNDLTEDEKATVKRIVELEVRF